MAKFRTFTGAQLTSIILGVLGFATLTVQQQCNHGKSIDKIDDAHKETITKVSNVSEKSDKHVSKIDTVIALEKDILELLKK